MSVRTYDPKKVLINFGGVPLTGYADGSFVTVTPNAEAFTKQVGADGEVVRSKSNDNTSEVTITLQQSSISNDYLSGVLAADRLTNAGKLPLQITDLNGTTLFFWSEAWLRQSADYDAAKEQGDRAWTFDTGQPVDYLVGGNN